VTIVASHSGNEIQTALDELLIRLVFAAGNREDGGQDDTADHENKRDVADVPHVFLLY
jgi:hypothetical protein